MEVYAIVNNSNPAWYCVRCHNPHKVLFRHGRIHYCPRCVPDVIKEEAIYVNQIGEPVEKVEE